MSTVRGEGRVHCKRGGVVGCVHCKRVGEGPL